jgi:hypothetical protein
MICPFQHHQPAKNSAKTIARTDLMANADWQRNNWVQPGRGQSQSAWVREIESRGWGIYTIITPRLKIKTQSRFFFFVKLEIEIPKTTQCVASVSIKLKANSNCLISLHVRMQSGRSHLHLIEE